MVAITEVCRVPGVHPEFLRSLYARIKTYCDSRDKWNHVRSQNVYRFSCPFGTGVLQLIGCGSVDIGMCFFQDFKTFQLMMLPPRKVGPVEGQGGFASNDPNLGLLADFYKDTHSSERRLPPRPFIILQPVQPILLHDRGVAEEG
jgi:hypothetical protein